jgi:hypothetical protein
MKIIPTERLHDANKNGRGEKGGGSGGGGQPGGGRSRRPDGGRQGKNWVMHHARKCRRNHVTHHAWNRGVELNMRATPTMQNFRSVSTIRHQNSSGRKRLTNTPFSKSREAQPRQVGKGLSYRLCCRQATTDIAGYTNTIETRTCTAPGTESGCGSTGWWPPRFPGPRPVRLGRHE